MNSLMKQQSAVPVRRDLKENLAVDTMIRIFEEVSLKRHLISCSPPVLPKEDELYIFDLGPDKSKWDRNKRKFRCDQYRWVTLGVYSVKSENHNIRKRSNAVDSKELPKEQGNMEFRRWEYWGYSSLFALHYTGDHTIYTPFAHRGAKEDKNVFVRSAPIVKEKVESSNPFLPNKQVYRDIVNKDTGGPTHAIQTPRNVEQVKNFRDRLNRESRISNDSLYNLYELSYQLNFPDRKGNPKPFITHITILPRLIVHLFPQPLIDSLQLLLNVQHSPTMLHYDTVFNVGEYYVSTITFRHSLFVNDPIIPCAFLIHTRKYASDHKFLFSTLVEAVPALLQKQVNIVTDREFEIGDIFPVGFQMYCWNHIERDLLWYARNKANCTAEDVAYIVSSFKRLMRHSEEIDFDRDWEDIKGTKIISGIPKLIEYLETKLIPAFKSHSSIWALKSAGYNDSLNGVTNNASESMNAVIRRLQNWKQAPLDVISLSFHQLSCFYYREIERSIHQCGGWVVKDQYHHFKRDPSLVPYMDAVPDPKDIVETIRGNVTKDNAILVGRTNFPPKRNDSHLAMARVAIESERVKLVDVGAWVVKESDGLNHCAVTLFPHEKCSCPSPVTCYHITACRLMAGLPASLEGKVNISELQRKHRQRKEKPAGRKQPRRNDFEPIGKSKRKKFDGDDIDCVQTEDEGESGALQQEKPSERKSVIAEDIQSTNCQILTGCVNDNSINDNNNCPDDISNPQTPVSKGDSDNERDIHKVIWKNDNIQPGSYLYELTKSKKVNVMKERVLYEDTINGMHITWNEYLRKLNTMYPDRLLVPYVCSATFDMEISGLNEGQLVLIETSRSQQVTLYKRLKDSSNNTPIIEVISTYRTPDRSELYYHAGVMLRRQRCLESFVVRCVGVQFSNVEQKVQVLLAAMVFESCRDHDACLTTVRCDKSLITQFIDFFEGNSSSFTLNQSNGEPYCRTMEEDVVVHCVCRCPWIEGTTSKAVYGEKLQKSFDMHVCVKCNRWFHKYCLSFCGLQVPKRNQDYVCPECKLPSTIPWHNDTYTNTCTCDNILTILLLYCNQHRTFLSVFNLSTPENTLKSSLTLMLQGNINQGKTVMLDYLKSSLQLPRDENYKFDFYGTEYAMFLSAFSHVFKLSVTKLCNSKYCPKPSSQRYHGTYSLSPESNGTKFADQFKQQFPSRGNPTGYCGAEFPGIPPNDAPQAVNDKLVVELNTRIKFIECRGTPFVQKSEFASKKTWMVPLNIAAFKEDTVKTLRTLPREMAIFGNKYRLAGYTMGSAGASQGSIGHFTAVILWKGKELFYDGLLPDSCRLVPLNDNIHFCGKEGSNAIYTLSV